MEFTVYVADNALTHAGIASILPGKVVGNAYIGQEALDQLGDLKPTVAVIGTCDGQCQHVIRNAGELGVNTLLICCGCHSVDLVESIGNGLMGFLNRSSSLGVVRDAIGRVARGETVLHDAHNKIVNGLRDAARPNVLTKRETEILSMMADGMTVKKIAARIFIAEPTVKFHTRNIYSKLGVNNKGAAIKIAMQNQIIK